MRGAAGFDDVDSAATRHTMPASITKGNLLLNTFREFSEDDCPRIAAALAYYVVFALPPLLVLMLMVAGLFMSPAEVESWLQGQISPGVGDQVGTMVQSANQKLSGGFSLSLILAIAGLIFSATGAFAQLQKALNTAWEVEQDPEVTGAKRVLRLLAKRLISLSMIVVMAFLIVVAMSISGLLSSLSGEVAQLLAPVGLEESASLALAWTADAVVSLLVLTVIFGAMFTVLPDVRLHWKDVRLGAVVTAVLFVIGKMGIGWYIGRSNPGETFGAASALAAILVFVYYASMIVLLGAEFTQVWARRQGRKIRPSRYAVRVVHETRAVREDGQRSEEPIRKS